MKTWISGHPEFRVGNILFKNAVIECRGNPDEEDGFDGKEIQDFAEWFEEIFPDGTLRMENVSPSIVMRYHGGLIYAIVKESQGTELLEDILDDKDAEVFSQITRPVTPDDLDELNEKLGK